MAWLCTAPTKTEKEKTTSVRLESLKEESTALCLPDVGGYITMCFDLIGRCKISDMGSQKPLEWIEVEAFSNQSGYKLSGWESERIIKMSRDYCAMVSKADYKNCPAPYRDCIDDEDSMRQMRDNVEKQLDQFFA